MPNITIMFWNIQTFGAASVTRGNYVAMCNFIARAAFNQGVDVLAIMEVQAAGNAHLYTLAQALNNTYGAPADWYYDVIDSAVRSNIGAASVNDAGDLAPDMDHHERYGLLWNNARNADFTILGTRGAYSAGARSPAPVGMGPAPAPPAGIPANALGLVGEGRNQGAVGANNWFNAPNFNPAAPGAGWAPLNFMLSNPVNYGDVRRGGSRRPCYFVVQLNGRAAPNNTPQHRFVPALVYHCSANSRSRRLNTQLSGYSRQLYQIDHTPLAAAPTWVTPANVIIAGDFNLDANSRNSHEWGGVAYDAYSVFTNAYNAGGANLTPWVDINSTDGGGVPNTPQTTVQLSWPIAGGPPIYSAAPGDYLRLAIDNAFYRLGANVNTVPAAAYQRIYNLLPEVIGGNLRDVTAAGLISHFWHQVLVAALGAAAPALGGGYPNYPNTDPTSGVPTYTENYSKRGNDGILRNYQREVPVVGNIRAWQRLRNRLLAGAFTIPGGAAASNARTAAEFVHKFISDHLPVTIRLNFT